LRAQAEQEIFAGRSECSSFSASVLRTTSARLKKVVNYLRKKWIPEKISGYAYVL